MKRRHWVWALASAVIVVGLAAFVLTAVRGPVACGCAGNPYGSVSGTIVSADENGGNFTLRTAAGEQRAFRLPPGDNKWPTLLAALQSGAPFEVEFLLTAPGDARFVSLLDRRTATPDR